MRVHHMSICLLHNNTALRQIGKADQNFLQIGKIIIKRQIVLIRLQDIVKSSTEHDLAGFRPYGLKVTRADTLSVDGRTRLILKETGMDICIRLPLIDESLIFNFKGAQEPL